MSLHRKRWLEIEATQWFKNGDHPEDGDVSKNGSPETGGLVVGWWGCGDIDIRGERPKQCALAGHETCGHNVCRTCGREMHEHGMFDDDDPGSMKQYGPLVICPGDWIQTREDGKNLAWPKEKFEAIYELVPEPTS